jgi:hypothetical protein
MRSAASLRELLDGGTCPATPHVGISVVASRDATTLTASRLTAFDARGQAKRTKVEQAPDKTDVESEGSDHIF